MRHGRVKAGQAAGICYEYGHPSNDQESDEYRVFKFTLRVADTCGKVQCVYIDVFVAAEVNIEI